MTDTNNEIEPPLSESKEAAAAPVYTVEKKFETLKKFVREMASFFHADLSMKLYNHLLRKTTMKNRVPALRHVKLFTEFCKANRDKIIESNSEFVMTKIEYSSRVYIDFSKIFRDIASDEESSAETRSVLFDHLLVLSMVFDSESTACDLIKARRQGAPEELKEIFGSSPFLADMMEKVEKQVKPGANPMEAMTEMMSSGLLQELVAGMQTNIENGDIDMNKLMSSVQRMTASLPKEQLAALNPMLEMAHGNMET